MLKQFSYPDVNLGIYANQEKITGKCLLSCYEHEDLKVYIVDIDQCFEVNLYDGKLAPLEKFPPAGEVFSVDLGSDGLHRAVHNENDSLFFIDSGEILEMASVADLKLFSLSKRAQNMAARAIPCNVIEALDECGNQINDLTKILFEEIFFTVLQIKDGILIVKLHKAQPVQTEIALSNTAQNEKMQLMREEIDMLYEEPEMVTTNALKAVLRYVPQDEKRNCPFYDPQTGRCFKENACLLEHVAPLDGGLTRDRKKAKHKLPSSCVPMIDSTVKICITCIISVSEFYAHIPELSARNMSGSLSELKQKLNRRDLVKLYERYEGVPDLQELVLVLHKGSYYRGKVIDNHNKHSSILFVDYGSVEWIHQKDIFYWLSRWDTIPVQVHRCFLKNIQLRQKNDKKAKEAFRNLILNGSNVSAKIISNVEDLFVLLYDENGFDIGETLSENGLAILKSKNIPLLTHCPI